MTRVIMNDERWLACRSTRSCSLSSPALRTRARCCTSPTRTRSTTLGCAVATASSTAFPVMLVDEAETVSDEEHERLLAKAAAEGIRPNFDAGEGAGERRRRRELDLARQPGHARGDRGPAGAARGLRRDGAHEVPRPSLARRPRAIVVLGMGGSGVAGEILQAIGEDQLRLPVVLVGDYCAPGVRRPEHARVRRLVLRPDRRDPRGRRDRS